MPYFYFLPIPAACNPHKLKVQLIGNQMSHHSTKSVQQEQRYDVFKVIIWKLPYRPLEKCLFAWQHTCGFIQNISHCRVGRDLDPFLFKSQFESNKFLFGFLFEPFLVSRIRIWILSNQPGFVIWIHINALQITNPVFD